MTSRERLIRTINHQEPDRVVFDLGATSQTGINASALYRLRNALGLKEKPVTVQEQAQILGQVDEDVLKAIGADVVGLWNPNNVVGVKNENWKRWSMPDGTPTYVAGDMKFSTDESGYTYIYPQGDNSVPASMVIPENGYFFDNIQRGGEFNPEKLTPIEDFKKDFSVFDDETAKYFEKESNRLFHETEYGIVGMCGGGDFGDVFTLPACWRKDKPQGIRNMEDWLMAHLLYPEYIKEVFELKAEVALKNLEIYRQAVGDRVQVIWLSGTDFGTQNGLFASIEVYRDLYKPFNKRINDWVHKNTSWKTFYHSCGSVVDLLDDFIEAGVDILNPVQCSAKGMNPQILKERYGDKLTFWGGGVDTQQTLPFGTREQVIKEVRERLEIFSKGGGYVFNAIHNIVGDTPVENIMAMVDTVKTYR